MLQFINAYGYQWPKHHDPKQNAEKFNKCYIQAASDQSLAVSLCKQKRIAIQAGGHCGMWAIWLAQRFGTVYTFEPDATNFACLAHNAALENIYMARGMLSDVYGPLDLELSGKYIGAHHGNHKPGLIPVYRIDDLKLPALDLLVLDVEGMELPALKGGVETIKKNLPPIHLEDRALGERYGFGSLADIKAWLGQWGYQEVGRVHHDVVLAVK